MVAVVAMTIESVVAAIAVAVNALQAPLLLQAETLLILQGYHWRWQQQSMQTLEQFDFLPSPRP